MKQITMQYVIYWLFTYILHFSYIDTEQYEEAVRDYEKITKMNHNHGERFYRF